jgi:hypothetical protein
MSGGTPLAVSLPLLQPGLNLLTGKPPLTTHLETAESTVLQHPIDRDAVHLEQFLKLFRR